MKNLKSNGLEITFEAGTKNVITWFGRSDARDPSSLINPYFEEIMDTLQGKELEVKFEHLQFINSSTLLTIVQMIKNLDQHRVKSTITYDKNSKWQGASFRALEIIVNSLEHIKVIGK